MAETKKVEGPKGLWVNLLDMDKFIRVNDLQPVTNPIYLERNVPTKDGLLSYEIFGTSTNDRHERMAYIPLHGHYMYPLAALKLRAYDRRLSDALFGVGKWKLTEKGDLIEDEDGGSGPEFVYSIWGKVKVKEKTTLTTKEIETFFKQDRKVLFTTSFPVIPAFFRDINTSGAGGQSKSTAEINSMYSSIISYAQSIQQYNTMWGSITTTTQGRLQTLLVDVYKNLMIQNVKGEPSKYGMLKRSLMSKSLDNSTRAVITAPILSSDSFEDTQVKFGYICLPLPFVMSQFYPFMVFHLKNFLDETFIRDGKRGIGQTNEDGTQNAGVTFTEGFSESEISSMITRYVNSPGCRFDEFMSPLDTNGKRYPVKLVGRRLKEDTTLERNATFTDIMYIVAVRMAEDKHCLTTRYPLDNSNGQFPAKITVASTVQTMPMLIGDETYRFFPTAEGDPANAFVDTIQMSNTYLGAMDGDYDGDQVTCKPVFTNEANKEAEDRINSNAAYLDVSGSFMRSLDRDFWAASYNMSYNSKLKLKSDVNTTPPKYPIS